MSKKFLCTAPWTGLHINPDGNVKVCCAGDSLGNLNDQSLSEVMNGGAMAKLQKDMLEQGFSDHCHTCMDMEKASGRSLREQFSTNLEDVDTTKFVPNNIDIRWSNLCQLRCAYCRPEWSTTYAKWEGVSGVVSTRKWQDEVLDFLEDYRGKDFKFVAMLGGEPLMLKENIKLLDYLKDDQNITVLSNLSLEKVESLPVYQRLLQKRTSWHISFEAIGNKFEYTRRNAKWEITSANYLKLKSELNERSQLGMHMTYCMLSAFSLCETFDWAASVGGNNTHILSSLIGPQQFNIEYFPKEIKLIAIREIDKTLEKHKSYLTPSLTSFLVNTKENLTNTLDFFGLDQIAIFKKFIVKNDSEVEGYSFASEWPEVHAVLEKYP